MRDFIFSAVIGLLIGSSLHTKKLLKDQYKKDAIQKILISKFKSVKYLNRLNSCTALGLNNLVINCKTCKKAKKSNYKLNKFILEIGLKN